MNLIFQYHIGSELDELQIKSRDSFSRYAKKIGADHLFSMDAHFTSHYDQSDPWVKSMAFYFEMLRPIYDLELDKKYDNIMFSDSDIIPVTNDNIFEEFTGEVAGVTEGDTQHANYLRGGDRNKNNTMSITNPQKLQQLRKLGVPLVKGTSLHETDIPWQMNSGIVIWSKEGRKKARERFDNWTDFLKDPNCTERWMHDQVFVSSQILKHGLNFQPLSPVWNENPAHFAHLKEYPNINLKFWHYADESKTPNSNRRGHANFDFKHFSVDIFDRML